MVTSDCGMFARLPQGSVQQFPAGDGAALTRALRALLQSGGKRQRAGAAALALGEKLGSWDGAAALTESAYRAAMEARA
jgi:hypothetical protein